jgi:hypothetical protein
MTKPESRCNLCGHLLKHHSDSGKCQSKYVLRNKVCNRQRITTNNVTSMHEFGIKNEGKVIK